MKLRSLWLGLICMMALGCTLTACSDDDDDRRDDTGTKVVLPRVRAFILNEGSYKGNNAGIAFYAPNGDAEFITDIYLKQNDKKLGETGQSMIEYDGEIFVAVYGSNYLAKLNAAGVEQARLSFVDDEDLSAGIRYIAAEGGYIYASFWGGAVAKINAHTMSVEKKLTNLGGCLEGVVINDGLLYVCNACSGDFATYYDEIIVINLNNFSLKEKLTTLHPNPYTQILEEEDKIFFISNGIYDYATGSMSPSILQVIDTKSNNKFSRICEASHIASFNDIVYIVNSVTNWNTFTTTNSFCTYDVKSGKLNEISFQKNAPAELASASIYMIQIDPVTGEVYIGTSEYSTNGTIYRFKRDGSYVSKFDAGGINPNHMVFLY